MRTTVMQLKQALQALGGTSEWVIGQLTCSKLPPLDP